MNITSDYIDFDKALNTGKRLLNDNKTYRIGFYIIFSINSGLRISDILNIRHSDLIGEKLVLKEKKTKKARIITINNEIKKAYTKLVEKLNENNVNHKDEDFIFISQKGTVYRTQSLNTILKNIFNGKSIQVSTHSLRKSFARRVYENNNQSENSLVLLSQIFSHSSIQITRRYLGLRQETIDNVYLTL